MPTTILLVRHAQSRPLREQADPAWALSDRGIEQAERLVAVLTALGVQRAYSSPYRRCLDTLAPFAAAKGVEVLIHEGLRERCLATGWIGDFRDVWQRSWADFSYAMDGGENSWTCQNRMMGAVREIATAHPGETIVAASHGFAIGLFLNAINPAFHRDAAGALRTPDLLKVTYARGVFVWDHKFQPGAEFDDLATDFRMTPGIVA